MDSATIKATTIASVPESEATVLIEKSTAKWYRRLFGGGWQYQYPRRIRNNSSFHSFDQAAADTRTDHDFHLNALYAHLDEQTKKYVLDEVISFEREIGRMRYDRISEQSQTPYLKQVLEGLERPSGDSRKNVLVGAFAIFIYLVVGIAAMVVLEGWHPRDAAYFCIVTITTVGYGDLSPTTEKSKIFVMFYVVVSIGLVASYLSYFVGIVLDEQEHALFQKRVEARHQQIYDRLRNDLDAQILHSTQPYDTSDFYHLVFSFSFLAVIFAIGLATFMSIEGLGIIDALYLIVISVSTVGFGDQHPKHPISRYLMMIWLVFGTVSAANVVGEITRIRLKSVQRSIARQILTVPIDKASLYVFDRNHTGVVSWGDFLEKMSTAAGQMEQHDIEMYRKRFQSLNPDINGLVRIESGILR